MFFDLVWVWNAFQHLSGRRAYGMNGPLPISFESMEAFCHLKKIHLEDEVDFMVDVIPQMDDIWLSDWYKRSEADQKLKRK